MATRWARFVRGWLAAIVSTFVAVSSHAVVDGKPSTFAILLSLAFSAIICVFLAGKRLSNLRLAGSVAASQLIYHTMFSVFGSPIHLSTPALAGTAHHIAAEQVVSQLTVESTASSHLHSAAGPWMAAAHVAAALLTFVALRYGEWSYWRLFQLARLAVTALLARVDALSTTRLERPVGEWPGFQPVRSRQLIQLSAMRHRGPPRARPV